MWRYPHSLTKMLLLSITQNPSVPTFFACPAFPFSRMVRLALFTLLALATLCFLSSSVSAGQCAPGLYCSDRSTCCIGTDGQYDCCPVYRAQCCEGGQTCCPLGYQCSPDGSSCVSDKKTHPLQATVGVAVAQDAVEIIKATPLEPPHAMLA